MRRLVLREFEPVTSWFAVKCSNHWATPIPILFAVLLKLCSAICAKEGVLPRLLYVWVRASSVLYFTKWSLLLGSQNLLNTMSTVNIYCCFYTLFCLYLSFRQYEAFLQHVLMCFRGSCVHLSVSIQGLFFEKGVSHPWRLSVCVCVSLCVCVLRPTLQRVIQLSQHLKH